MNGDRELAYQGDPMTGVSTQTGGHEHHIWDLAKVRALIADHSQPATYLCGGSRNSGQFIDELDAVFVLDVDAETLVRRLDQRPAGERGHHPAERALVLRLHRTREDTPRNGIVVDARPALVEVVNTILSLSRTIGSNETK